MHRLFQKRDGGECQITMTVESLGYGNLGYRFEHGDFVVPMGGDKSRRGQLKPGVLLQYGVEPTPSESFLCGERKPGKKVFAANIGIDCLTVKPNQMCKPRFFAARRTVKRAQKTPKKYM